MYKQKTLAKYKPLFSCGPNCVKSCYRYWVCAWIFADIFVKREARRREKREIFFQPPRKTGKTNNQTGEGRKESGRRVKRWREKGGALRLTNRMHAPENRKNERGRDKSRRMYVVYDTFPEKVEVPPNDPATA